MLLQYHEIEKDLKMIVDVREIHEFQAEHIAGSINIPLSQLPELSLEFFKAYPQEPLIILCRMGPRAERARQYWLENNFCGPERMTVYQGGISQWKADGNPVHGG